MYNSLNNCYISNKGFLEECDKVENVDWSRPGSRHNDKYT